jgi:hypothetical protein
MPKTVTKLSGGHIPERRGRVMAAGQQGLAIGTEGDGSDRSLVLKASGTGLSGGDIPDLDIPFRAPRSHQVAVGAKCRDLDVPLMGQS